MFADEITGKRVILSFDNDALTEPLPELCLCRPKLLLIPADDQCRMLFLFFTFLFAHANYSFTQANKFSRLSETGQTCETTMGSL